MPNFSKYLHKLNFDDKTLLVKIQELKESQRWDAAYENGLGRYIQWEPTSIEGAFIVDNVHNSILDIQECLGSPFTKHPVLEYDSRLYEVVINGLSWNFEPDGADEDAFGHSIHYRCTFLATSVKEQENALIWDAGTKDSVNLADVQELIGNENLLELAAKAVALIDKYQYFTPTGDCWTPSSKEGAGGEDDVAAVLAGSKPAAVVDEAELVQRPLLVLLLKEASTRGLDIATVENFSTKHTQKHSLVVGEDYNVKQIVEIMSQAVRDNAVNGYYYWRLGKLLGHPVDDLEYLIKNIKGFCA